MVDDAAQVRVEHLRSDEVRTFELVVLVGDAGPVEEAVELALAVADRSLVDVVAQAAHEEDPLASVRIDVRYRGAGNDSADEFLPTPQGQSSVTVN